MRCALEWQKAADWRRERRKEPVWPAPDCRMGKPPSSCIWHCNSTVRIWCSLTPRFLTFLFQTLIVIGMFYKIFETCVMKWDVITFLLTTVHTCFRFHFSIPGSHSGYHTTCSCDVSTPPLGCASFSLFLAGLDCNDGFWGDLQSGHSRWLLSCSLYIPCLTSACFT